MMPSATKKNKSKTPAGTKKAHGAKIIVAHIPVLHEGYKRLFEKYPDATQLFLLGEKITCDFRQLTKDIRALKPELIKKAVESWGRFEKVEIIDGEGLKGLSKHFQSDWFSGGTEIIMPDEDIMHELAEKYLPVDVASKNKAKIVFDSIFLRWDKHSSFKNNPIEADQKTSIKDSDRKIISLLRVEAEKSSDFWRQIGAAIVKDGKIVSMTHNRSVPVEGLNYSEGDPRSDFHKGVNVELSLFFHCEAALIAEAAKKGISLEGAELFVTTFPCPPCAKLVAYSGIKKIYYSDGYGTLDGERVLKSQGVEIVFVKTE